MSNVLVLRKQDPQAQSLITPTVTSQGAGMQMNLPGGQGVTGWGRAIPAMGAAWGALNALSSDDQGDLFSTIGNAGMRGYTGYQAASQALGPAQRYAHQFTPAGRRAAAASAAAAAAAPPPAAPALAAVTRAGIANAPLMPLSHMPLPHAAGNSTAGSAVDDSAAEDKYERTTAKESDGGAGVPTDPQQTTPNHYGKFTNLMHNESKQITAEEAQKEGVKSSGMAHGEPSVSAVEEAAVDTGEKIMGASAQGGLTAEEAKKKVVKSRRPWSYY